MMENVIIKKDYVDLPHNYLKIYKKEIDVENLSDIDI